MADISGNPDDEVCKRGRGRPQKYENGWKGHYDDINYNLTYYHSHKDRIHCPICNKLTNKLKIREHQRSKKCQQIKKLNEAVDYYRNIVF